MPFIITTKRPNAEAIADHDRTGDQFTGDGARWLCTLPESRQFVVSRHAVATLEERYVFDSAEWRAAGFDQPDGNYQFWHPALVLARHEHEGHYRDRETSETFDVLWLHTGHESSGHLTYLTGRSGEPTNRLAPFPSRWPERLISESGGSVGPLPDLTVIEVEMSTWEWLAADAGLAGTVLGHMAACGDTEAQHKIVAAYDAKAGAIHV